MILFNVPIGVRAIPKLVKQWFADIALLNKRDEPRYFNFVYFSYEPDFDYLLLSIKSLVRHFEYIRTITIFVDQKAPFSVKQEEVLSNLSSEISFKTINNFSWASTESTKAEFDAFLSVTELAPAEDYIAKVDSDILFFESKKLKRIAFSNLPAVGDGHWDGWQFFQGGFYIAKVSALRSALIDLDIDKLNRMIRVSLDGISAEDRCVTQALREHNVPLHFTQLMLFPSEYQRIKRINRFVRWDYCAMHFVKDKERMQEYFSRFC